MGDWLPIILLMGVAYGLVLLQQIAGGVGAINDKLVELLTHEGVKGYDTDTDPD